jgi:hypothetical protein
MVVNILNPSNVIGSKMFAIWFEDVVNMKGRLEDEMQPQMHRVQADER